jgi:dTMP kinase
LILEGKIPLFISFEGIDGCGKSTQVSRFAATLRSRGIRVLVTREPGGTKIGKGIRDILLRAENIHLAPLAELFLYAADRAQHVAEVIRPALEAKKWVVCDRFFDATTVYQGLSLEGYDRLIEAVNREITLGCQPDLTFLLDCPAEVGLERIATRHRRRKDRDRFERKALDFHIKVRYGYLTLANRYKDRFRIIDGTLPADRVEKRIREIIDPYLPSQP